MKKHTLIIGGTKGIGLALVRSLSQEGNIVSVIGRSLPQESDRKIENVTFWNVNLLDKERIIIVLDEIIKKQGKLNSLVFSQRYRGKEDDWEGEMDTSITSTKQIIEYLSNQFEGDGNSIVIVSSVASQFIVEEQPLSYHIAKAALNQMVRYYAVALGKKNIRINSVSPGTVLKEESKKIYLENEELLNHFKEIIPLKRMGTSEDVVNVIKFLCSSNASFITGQNIFVDGGVSLQGHESLTRRLKSLNQKKALGDDKDNNNNNNPPKDINKIPKDVKKRLFRRDNCRLCNSNNLELAIKLEPSPIGDAYLPIKCADETQIAYPVEVFLCKDCGHAQLLDVIDPEIIYGNYIYKTSDSLGLVEHFGRYVDYIFDRINPLEEGLVVEIGSNDGSFLRFFKNRGMRVLGVDPAREIAHQVTKSGIEIIPALFTKEVACKIKQEKGIASIIIANNVFANADNLIEIVDGIRELLAPEGVFVLETGYVLDLLQKGIFDNIYHEHLSYFSVKPLQDFFCNNGMELIDVEHGPTKGGSIRCIMQLKGGARKVSPNVDKFIELEKQQKVHDIETFKKFSLKLINYKNNLINLLCSLKVQGKKIVGYGAVVGITTMMYHFSLNNELLDFLVDDNPRRQNTYSPGFHIPVLSPTEIYNKNPDYVIILAWQYTAPILKKHQAYLNRGGKFIILNPAANSGFEISIVNE